MLAARKNVITFPGFVMKFDKERLSTIYPTAKISKTLTKRWESSTPCAPKGIRGHLLRIRHLCLGTNLAMKGTFLSLFENSIQIGRTGSKLLSNPPNTHQFVLSSSTISPLAKIFRFCRVRCQQAGSLSKDWSRTRLSLSLLKNISAPLVDSLAFFSVSWIFRPNVALHWL